MSDTPNTAPNTTADTRAPRKGRKKLLIGAVALLAIAGGGVAAGVYAASSGMIGGASHAEAEAADLPRLVLKKDQKPAETEEGGKAEGETDTGHGGGMPTPEGKGGEKYASTYYAMEKDFTANLQESVHFVQVGVAVSTPYDEKVVEHLKTNDIAVRSAILMTLGDTSEEQVFTSEGKRQLQARLVKAINRTLEQKEGFGGVGNVYFTSFVVQ